MPLMNLNFNTRVYVFNTTTKTVRVVYPGSNEEIYAGSYNDMQTCVLALDKKLSTETRTKLNGRTYVHNRESYTVRVYEDDKQIRTYHDVVLKEFDNKVRQIDAELSDKVIPRGGGTFEYKSAGYENRVEYSNSNLRISIKCVDVDVGIKKIDRILRDANVFDRDS